MDGRRHVAVLRAGDVHPDDHGPPVQYHLGDHLGSSTLVVDGSGGWVNREEYTPFGDTVFGGFARKRYRFTGRERDAESGLSYHGARYYAPWLLRWTSCDPAGTRDGVNLYAYTRNNPVNLRDPHGLASETPPNTPPTSNVAPKGEFGHVAPHSAQGPARHDVRGLRTSESEHVMSKAKLKTLTRNPATGKSDFTEGQYRRSSTVLFEREAALQKTHGNRGGAGADNPAAKRLRAIAERGGSIDYRENVFLDSMENMKAARTATGSVVSDEAIHTALLGEEGELFRTFPRGSAGQRATELGSVVEDFAIVEWNAPSPSRSCMRAAVEPPVSRTPVGASRASSFLRGPVGFGLGAAGTFLTLTSNTPHYYESQYNTEDAELEYFAASLAHAVGLTNKEPTKPPHMDAKNFEPGPNLLDPFIWIYDVLVPSAY
jgi:RHS repeat-associated protein